MNIKHKPNAGNRVSAGCHINDVMNKGKQAWDTVLVSAGCHINDVMNKGKQAWDTVLVSAGCHINDVMNN